ncbi:lysostaphin resistance A-like protein [Maribacter sp. IgM3_T14_3]|uniref:CPBP family intramembrane glutamic endopeptidase n=1 Tax=Maribacter sp. IgM3_T14_3 TaxID=3415140 RepID=UPI003C701A1A
MQLIQKHKSFLLILFALVLIHLLHGLILWPTMQLGLSNEKVDIISLITIPIVTLIGIAYLLKQFGIHLNFSFKKVNPILIFYVLLLAVFCIIFQSALDIPFIIELLQSKLRFFAFTNPFQYGLHSIVYLFGAVIVAPITEEILYRKIIFIKLKEQYGLAFALVVSSFLFALIHWNLEGLLAYFASGLLLAYLYHITKVLWLNILLHGSYNFLAMITTIEMFDSSHRMFVIILLLYLISAAGIYMILKEVKTLTN